MQRNNTGIYSLKVAEEVLAQSSHDLIGQRRPRAGEVFLRDYLYHFRQVRSANKAHFALISIVLKLILQTL